MERISDKIDEYITESESYKEIGEETQAWIKELRERNRCYFKLDDEDHTSFIWHDTVKNRCDLDGTFTI